MAASDSQAVQRRQPHPRRRFDVTVHELDDEALVYDPMTGSTHRLNATALFIWYACDGSQDTRAVARRLAEAYEVSEDAAVTHVERLLAALQSQRLLEDRDDEGDACK